MNNAPQAKQARAQPRGADNSHCVFVAGAHCRPCLSTALAIQTIMRLSCLNRNNDRSRVIGETVSLETVLHYSTFAVTPTSTRLSPQSHKTVTESECTRDVFARKCCVDLFVTGAGSRGGGGWETNKCGIGRVQWVEGRSLTVLRFGGLVRGWDEEATVYCCCRRNEAGEVGDGNMDKNE